MYNYLSLVYDCGRVNNGQRIIFFQRYFYNLTANVILHISL